MNSNAVMEICQSAIMPDPLLTVSEWADQNRILSSKESAEPGPWRTSRVPYLQEIMDCLSPSHPAQKVVFMKPAQIAGTEAGINWLGCTMDLFPSPIMVVQPTIDMCKRFSKQRITPMTLNTPSLQSKIKEPRKRDSGNTMFSKEFEGGILIMTWANSGTGLRSMPAKNIMLDEIDAYPLDVDGEGDPVAIAEKRATTYPGKKIFLLSTPTEAYKSRIKKEINNSNQKYYYLPCPFCGEYQKLQWANLVFDSKQLGDVHYRCFKCEKLIPEFYKTEMLLAGRWVEENPGHPVEGFSLNGLYSPLGWKSWQEGVVEFLKAVRENDKAQLKVWTNTYLAEVWEDDVEKIDDQKISQRRESYDAAVPDGAVILTAGADVQKDRIECTVAGWGYGYECWVIDHRIIIGDPAQDDVWNEFDEFLLSEFRNAEGQMFRLNAALIDSGFMTQRVYQFVKSRETRKVFTSKGSSIEGRPLISKPSRVGAEGVHLFAIGTNTAKDLIFQRLEITEPGPGYIHFPDFLDEEYFKQLTAEEVRLKKIRGYLHRIYQKIRERNEALDCFVGSVAALYLLNIRDFNRTIQAIRTGTPIQAQQKRGVRHRGINE